MLERILAFALVVGAIFALATVFSSPDESVEDAPTLDAPEDAPLEALPPADVPIEEDDDGADDDDDAPAEEAPAPPQKRKGKGSGG